MTLSENEYRVLNVLLKDPSLSYTDIAKVLNLSVTSIRNLLFSLMDYTPTSTLDDDDTSQVSTRNGYVDSQPQKNNSLSFFAKFNYDSLNLTRFDFFISCSALEQMENIKIFCYAHPYTNFRGRIHGGSSGVYVIFYMPAEILGMLIFSLETLKNEHKIEDYAQLIKDSSFTLYSMLKIDVFDVAQNRWNFEFGEFKDNFRNNKQNSPLTDFFKKKQTKSILNHLDKIDTMILNEWGYGAGPRKTKAELLNNITTFPIYQEISQELKLNRYIISDHVDALEKDNIIKNIGIGFDRRKIQILATLFFTGQANAEFLNSFGNYIQSDEFPFESTLNVGDLQGKVANFTWWVSSTAELVSEFTEFLFENSSNLQIFIVINNTSDIENFPLYHANFIASTPTGGRWNTSVETCLVKPLEVFLNPDKLQSLANDYQVFQKHNIP